MTAVRDMVVTEDLMRGLMVGRVWSRVYGEGGGTVVIVPDLVSVKPGTERMNEPTVGSNEMCLDQVVPEKFEIGLGWTALSWETPFAAAVGWAFTLEGVRVNEEAVAGGKVAEAKSLEEETAPL